MALNPCLSASAILRSILETALISPDKPTSPAKQICLCNAWSSNEEIKEAMNGNICRCGTYNKILKAVTAVAKG